jgi:hypothetical protein
VGVTATIFTSLISSGPGGGGGAAAVAGGCDTGDWELVVDAGGAARATGCIAGAAIAGIGSPVAGGTGSGTIATCGDTALCRARTVGCGSVDFGEATGGTGAAVACGRSAGTVGVASAGAMTAAGAA